MNNDIYVREVSIFFFIDLLNFQLQFMFLISNYDLTPTTEEDFRLCIRTRQLLQIHVKLLVKTLEYNAKQCRSWWKSTATRVNVKNLNKIIYTNTA